MTTATLGSLLGVIGSICLAVPYFVDLRRRMRRDRELAKARRRNAGHAVHQAIIDAHTEAVLSGGMWVPAVALLGTLCLAASLFLLFR